MQGNVVVITGASSGIGSSLAKTFSEAGYQLRLLANRNIRICYISSAKIQTPLLIDAGLEQRATITAEQFAKLILWLYQQPQEICIRDMIVAPTIYEA